LLDELLPFGLPVVCAGGVGDATGFVDALRMGYAGVQCGTRFIATRECDASEAYKAAILATDASGIVLTERLTGVPLAVIDTPAVRRMGLHANGVERWLLKNPRTKHALRMLLTVRSAWSLRRGARVDRSQLWQAGKSVAGIHSIEPAGAIVRRWASAWWPRTESHPATIDRAPAGIRRRPIDRGLKSDVRRVQTLAVLWFANSNDTSSRVERIKSRRGERQWVFAEESSVPARCVHSSRQRRSLGLRTA
jgi:hypothetical protein